MDVQENYEQLIAPFRLVQSYREQAEKLALQIFNALDEARTFALLDLLKQVCKEKSSTYRFFLNNYSGIQQGKTTLTRTHFRYLLSVIPAFASPTEQALLLRLELFDYLQTQKIAITRNYSSQVDVQGAFDSYSKYLASMYYLGGMPSSWFAEKSFLPEDRRQVVEAVMYVSVMKLKISVSHFKKDMALIASKSQNLSKKMTYFLELLGIEVRVEGKDYDLNSLSVFDEMPLPAFVGKLAEPLKAYLAGEFEVQDYQLVLREVQEAVLANDLGVAIQHYKNNNTLNSRADISFALHGGAGIVRLEIRSWVNRLLVGDLRWWEIVVLTLCMGVPLAYFHLAGLFITFSLLSARKFGKVKDPEEEAQERVQQQNLDLAYIREPAIQQYRQMVRDIQAEQGYILLNQGLIEELAYNLHAKLRKQAFANVENDADSSPLKTQALFEAYHQALAQATYQDMNTTRENDIAIEHKQEIFNTIRYVLEQQYFKARVQFNRLMDLLMQYSVEAKYYLLFLDTESVLYHDFYEHDETVPINLSKIVLYAHDNNNPQIFFLKPNPQGKYAEQLNIWLEQELSDATQSDYETDFAQTKSYLQFLEQSRATPYLTIAPLVLEFETGILCI